MNTWNQVYDPFGSPWLSTLAASPTGHRPARHDRQRQSEGPYRGRSVPGPGLLRRRLPLRHAGGSGHARFRLWAWRSGCSRSAGSSSTSSSSTVSRWRRAGSPRCSNRWPASPPTGGFSSSSSPSAFGAFFEGAGGFGTPVAVTGAILIGLGFSPLAASGLSLIANTAPVAYGALGAPIQGLASVTGYDPYILGAMIGRQLPFFSVLVPFWLIWVFAGFRGMVQIWARHPGLRRLVRAGPVRHLELRQPCGSSISVPPSSPWAPWSCS